MKSAVILAKIYADALFMLAKDSGKVDDCLNDLQELVQLFNESKEFRVFFVSPTISRKIKTEIIRELFESKIDKFVLNFICVLIKKGRESELVNIYSAFVKHKDFSENRIFAKTITAKKLGEDLIEKIQTKLSERLQKNVVIEETINENIIGGLIIRIGDIMIDGSIRTKLRKFKQDFYLKQQSMM